MSDTSPSDYGGWGMAFEVSNPAAQRGIPGQDVPEVQGPSQFAPGTNISVGPAGTMQDTIDAFFGKPENVAKAVGALAPGFNMASGLARGVASGLGSLFDSLGVKGTAPSEVAPAFDPSVDDYGTKDSRDNLMAQLQQGIYQSPLSPYAGLAPYANRPGVSAVVQALQSNPFISALPTMAATYLAGGGYVPGKSGGMDDDVPAIIDGKQPAKLSSGEFVFDAATVAALGDGNNQAGARKLEEIRRAIRKRAYGHEKQPPKNYDIATLMART